MLNAEEFVAPELKVVLSHVKEAVRVVLHTLVVCRSLGGSRPLEPKERFSEVLNLSYMTTDELDVEQEVNSWAREFSEMFDVRWPVGGRAQLVLSFYSLASKKSSLWKTIIGTDEKIVFEQWRFPMVVQHARRFKDPTDNIKEESKNNSMAHQQVLAVLQFVFSKVASKVDHLPAPNSEKACFRFEVTFASGDGKEMGKGGLLPNGFGTSLSQTLKIIPKLS
mmetsp:Transcript_10930/g.23829  ORF Transcript_10930/g.23829 Transcript_10930/m.23829 type:complete len:222 (+) Transcript_10930:193-858(+)|eukprot:CAMPEP_0206599646 /NCGR_PEP_ID=MMETSP0325_2-20121206/45298_1 /ASSEMBLY_ACC=CAM_ASM_000347 /TAXON_ID=2866 /ORGANISM="Crypthecodinium cohnii, Strain Seligo" /LENGTH=221 /DNA_ID=CAMNT_0054110747 /DNA_START=389 /DNA_END=1054 /DNA_ORIENTATION=-